MTAAWGALQNGLRRALTSVRLVLTFTLLNLAFAVLAILPLARALDRLLSPAGASSGLLAAWPTIIGLALIPVTVIELTKLVRHGVH